MATASIVGIALSLSTPLLSLVLEAQGVPRGLIGLNAASGGLGALLVAPFVGRLVDWGASRVMAAGIILCAAVVLVLPLRVELWTWFALRVVFSAGLALLFIMSESAVNALVPETMRARVMGLYGTLFSVGYVVGPLIIAAVGSDGFLPFAIGAAILAAGLVPLWGAGAIDRALRADGDTHRAPLAPLARMRRAPLVFATAILFTTIESAHFAFLALFALSHGWLEQAGALLLGAFIAGNIILQVPIGWLADRFGRTRVLVAVACGTAVGHLAMLPAIGAGWPIWPLLIALGGAVGALYSLGLALLGERFPRHELAPANALFVVMVQLGVLVGPSAVGVGMQAAGAAAFPILMCAAALLLPAGVLAARQRVP